jgi:pimeloyl-ACP methyl ester carboxylesterase
MRESDATGEGRERRDPSAPPAIVLVHGACSHSGCWTPTIAALAARAPNVRVLAVDLPGRGRAAVPLAGVTLGRCVDEVVRQIEAAGLGDVVLVGHSLAGAILPGVATRLGSGRVQHLVFLTCAVPPEGGSVVDVLRGPLRAIAAVAARRRSPTRLPTFVALATFANGMDREQRRVVAESLCPEAGWLIGEAVSRQGFSPTIPRTWILTRRDRGLTPTQQRRSIDNLGGVDECVELDAPHDAMVSHPDELADALLARVRGIAIEMVAE